MNLNQITLTVSDIEKSIEFYTQLGLELIVHTNNHYARFVCDNNATFSIHKGEEETINSSTWIYFEIENLDQKVTNLQQKGFVFEELPTNKPWLWREARLKDLDHNTIILYFAGDNRVNPPWKIKH